MNVAVQKEEVSRFWSKIGLVAEIARILREKPTGKKALLEVLELISEIIEFDSATLYLLNRRKDKLDEVATRGKTVNLVNFLRFDRGPGLAAWATKQRRTLYIPGRDPELENVREHHDSVILLPLIVEDDLVGILCFSNHRSHAFDKNKQRFLEIVADQVAISLERIMYQRELELKNESLIAAQEKLQEAQEKLIEQEKLKAVVELAASVNHEVNNPLSAIVGNAQMIELELESAGLPEQFTQRIQSIVDAARRISLITHKLLKIDKLVSEQYLTGNRSNMLNLKESVGDIQ